MDKKPSKDINELAFSVVQAATSGKPKVTQIKRSPGIVRVAASTGKPAAKKDLSRSKTKR